MIKDDTKDQIPLFDVPAAKKEEPPAPEARPAVQTKAQETSSPKKQVKAAGVAPAKTGGTGGRTKTGPTAVKGVVKGSLSGQVPAGDVRLTANIRDDLHLKLKIAAARRRTTIGELIEELVEQYL
jgi:hypothetical protein